MKKLSGSKDTWLLLEFFVNNAFKGLLNRPFLRSRVNRLIILSLLVVGYLLYFYMNMRELSKLASGTIGISNRLLVVSQKITFFSFCDTTLVLGMIISVFVNFTLTLDRTSLFFAQTLPFPTSKVRRAFMIFKLLVAAVIYGGIALISTPMIKLITSELWAGVCFFLSQQIWFVTVFLLGELIFQLPQYIPISHQLKQFLHLLLGTIVLGLSVAYYFGFRYDIEPKWAQTDLTVGQLIAGATCFGLVGLGALFGLMSRLPLVRTLNFDSRFVNLAVGAPAIFRHKGNVQTLLFFVLLIAFNCYQSGWQLAYHYVKLYLPMLSLLLLSFRDATLAWSRQYPLLRIGPVDELWEHLKIMIIVAMPNLLVWLLGQIPTINSIQMLVYCLIALILGGLLPKTQSSFNETSSTLLFLILVVTMQFLLKDLSLSLLALAILVMVDFYVICEERRKNEKRI